jgi:inner membrane protein
MDNITHTLIGITVGQLASKTKSVAGNEKHETARRRLLIWSSVIGNNFPDLDVLYTWITPGSLGGLLHHRGHTHTLIGILPQWMIAAFLFWLVRKRFGFSELSRRDWVRGGLVGALGFFLHIFADSFNSYGVHPFFPFWNGWIYGDAVFIIEPVLWSILATSIFWASSNKLKVLPLILLAGLLIFGWCQEFLSSSTVVSVAAVSGILYYYFKFLKQSAPLIASILVAIFVMCNFTLGLLLRRSFYENQAAGERILDISLSPVPANPLCWLTIRVAVVNETYIVKRGISSIVPEIIDPSACPDLGRIESGVSAEFERVGQAKVKWGEVHLTRLQDFKILESNCYLRAWMRFARVPFVQDDLATDLRFSRRRISNFTDLESKGGECPPNIPPWIPPRQDLIELIGGAGWF